MEGFGDWNTSKFMKNKRIEDLTCYFKIFCEIKNKTKTKKRKYYSHVELLF